MQTDTVDPTAPASEPASPVTAGEAPPFNGLPAAEAIAKAQEQLAPVDRPLPGFEPPPHDPKEWGLKIEAKEREIDGKFLAFEKSAKQTKTLKADYDNANKELHALIRAMRESRLRAEGQLVQPLLRPVPQGVAGSSCRYEQLKNEPCPMCILLRASGSPLPDPEDTEHYENVLAALEPPDAGELATWVEQVCGQMLSINMVKAWTDAQRTEVQLWCAAMEQLQGSGANEPARPAILGTPHVADAAGTSVQSCVRCKNVLLDLAKPDVLAYDEGAQVGTDCVPDGEIERKAEEAVGDAAAALDTTLAEHKVCLCTIPDVPKGETRCARCATSTRTSRTSGAP